MPINVVISATEHQVTVRVRGDLDAASADYLSAVLEGADEVPHLVVDLSAAPFADIPGVRAIAECATRRGRSGHDLVVAAPPPSAETILRMMPPRGCLRWEPRKPTVP